MFDGVVLLTTSADVTGTAKGCRDDLVPICHLDNGTIWYVEAVSGLSALRN